ncbi:MULTISPECIES: GNAT family N-acetyltransferase [Rhodobacterales]|jgi:GNAT superfamily N-acetyltransferase|uniref:GNAT family N-acetyltransferase n=1 Tax=Rhodobacterales TaxID=204455 RepID=UPI00237F78B6|nr:GNAT family N-acetyltransferase [Phaeobacter gallaeciensis]MDE4142810.1 GNAT family N-acetyltransferase [Phaeobacter gallaeciensis]MDE4151220.1 GNAT family N-acetyltransferase [Phaeobacter gallaeciensis]MDE4155486.1 GNAT family N-acetyltransferase [Phaeobacter gallaeciensis]MDE4230877.1 GNAT family N-acetyltransferase [Phaeobacter gallaeciensis]MDE4259952.1 GNAT family N-acetyltransferase [Phaeobacter gallaeciensis]
MEIRFRPAGAQDVPALHWALTQLSQDLGDRHVAGEADLMRAGFGADPAFGALLAEAGPPVAARTVGASLFSPVFSTVRGAAGVYVADLWVAADVRGQRLGQRLLAAVLQEAQRRWDARFLKLNVYDDSPDARRFYDRLGFKPAVSQTEMILDEAGCAALRGET